MTARWPRAAAAVAVALTAIALPFLARLRVDNSPEVWLDRGSPGYARYQEMLSTFGSEELVLLAYDRPRPFDLDFLERLTDLALDLEAVDGVARVHCLSRVYGTFYGLSGVEAFEREIDGSPFYRGFLLSGDGSRAAVWAALNPLGAEERREAVEAVEALAAGADLGSPVRLAGSPVLTVALDRASRHSARRLFPPVFALSGVVLLVLFRRLVGLVLPFLAVGAGIAWTLALVAACGVPLNMLTVALPPLVWVLGLATSIHLLARWRRRLEHGAAPREAARLALAELARPCLWSAVTTALGFASLAASDLAPVRQMGLLSACGVLFCLLASFLLFPLLAGSSWLAGGARRGAGKRAACRSWADRRLARCLVVLGRLGRRRGWTGAVLAVSAVLLALMAGAVLRLRAEANPLSFFKPEAEIVRTYREVLDGFTGPYSLEILLSPGGAEPELETLRRVEDLARWLESRPEVARVLTVADLVKRAHQGAQGDPAADYRLPEDGAGLGAAWHDLGLSAAPEMAAFFDPESGTLRLSVLARVMGSGGHRRLVEAIEGKLGTDLPASWRPRLTGIVPLLVDMQARLITSQVRTFGLAFLVIGPVMAWLLRSPRAALLSLLPNLLPVVSALAWMGALGVPLDPATTMIAGIALGIAVDDTIHFLAAYRARLREGRQPERAVAGSLLAVGRPVVLTTAVASAGFLVLCLSDFVPLSRFGLLTAETLVVALAADLVLLPALLLRFGRRR